MRVVVVDRGPEFQRFADLADELAREVGAALQTMEAARPLVADGPVGDWLRSEPDKHVVVSMYRAATVAACTSLMRVWAPSGDSFSIEKLSAALSRLQDTEASRLGELRALLRRDAQFRSALDALIRWRDKRVAHRVTDAINAERDADRKAMQPDFDLVLERSVRIVEVIRVAFPAIGLLDLVSQRELWRDTAGLFWRQMAEARTKALREWP